jgi:hypothetical protein
MRLSEHFLDHRQADWELRMQMTVRGTDRPVVLRISSCADEVCVELSHAYDREEDPDFLMIVPPSDLASFLRRVLSQLDEDLDAYDDEDPESPSSGWARRQAQARAQSVKPSKNITILDSKKKSKR